MIKPRHPEIHCQTCQGRHLCITSGVDEAGKVILNELIKTIRFVSKKEIVMQANTPMQNLYAVYSGSCKEYWTDVNGNECVNNFFFPGDIIGIESIAGKKYMFSLSALEDTELCVIPMTGFLEAMYKNPSILKRFINISSLKMQNDQSARSGITALERVCDFLLNIISRTYERTPQIKEIVLPMSQVEISDFLGITYETVNRIFKTLKRKKIIKMKNKTLEVLDMAELENLKRG